MRRLYMVLNLVLLAAVVLPLVAGWVSKCLASDPGKATKEECVAKCKEAADLIEKIGLKPALDKMNDPQRGFAWKDSYVFCFDEEKLKILAHRVSRLVGWNIKNYRSADGRLIFQEMVEVAQKQGSGWITYDYLRRGEQKPSPKTTYFLRVPEEKVILGAGYYE